MGKNLHRKTKKRPLARSSAAGRSWKNPIQPPLFPHFEPEIWTCEGIFGPDQGNRKQYPRPDFRPLRPVSGEASEGRSLRFWTAAEPAGPFQRKKTRARISRRSRARQSSQPILPSPREEFPTPVCQVRDKKYNPEKRKT